MPNATIQPHQQRLPHLLFCCHFACRVVYTVTGAAEVAQPSHVPGHVANVHPHFFLYRAFISASYFLKMTSRFIFMVGVSSPVSTWGERDPQVEARRDPILDSSTSLHLPKPVYTATRVLGKVVYDLREFGRSAAATSGPGSSRHPRVRETSQKRMGSFNAYRESFVNDGDRTYPFVGMEIALCETAKGIRGVTSEPKQACNSIQDQTRCNTLPATTSTRQQ